MNKQIPISCKVFISYRRADLGGHANLIAGRICDQLSERYGSKDVFLDVDTIPAGVDFVKYLAESIERADVLLAVMGPEWVPLMKERGGNRDYVKVEIQMALERNMPVVPLLLGGAQMPQASDLPVELASLERRNGFTIDTGRDFKMNMARLIDDLDAGIARKRGEAAASRKTGDPQQATATTSYNECARKPEISGSAKIFIGGTMVILCGIGVILGLLQPWKPDSSEASRSPGPVSPSSSPDPPPASSKVTAPRETRDPSLIIFGDKKPDAVHYYSAITAAKVEAALVESAKKDDLLTAEAGLAALGWFVLYGNDSESRALGSRLAAVASGTCDGFKGSDTEEEEFRNRYNLIQGEIFSLDRWDNPPPASPSPEYAELTRKRVSSALESGSGSAEEALAEGSLCALGWLTLYGNDRDSLDRANKMMKAASELWRGSNGIFMKRSKSAYDEMINLARF